MLLIKLNLIPNGLIFMYNIKLNLIPINTCNCKPHNSIAPYAWEHIHKHTRVRFLLCLTTPMVWKDLFYILVSFSSFWGGETRSLTLCLPTDKGRNRVSSLCLIRGRLYCLIRGSQSKLRKSFLPCPGSSEPAQVSKDSIFFLISGVCVLPT